MFGTCMGVRFSLRVRDEDAVKVVEPASMNEREPPPLQAPPALLLRSRSCSGVLQPMANLPPDTDVNRVTSKPVLSNTEKRPSPLVVSKTLNNTVVSALWTTVRTFWLPAWLLRVSLASAEAVPMPTLPPALMSIELVGAPGRMRKGRREPPVT